MDKIEKLIKLLNQNAPDSKFYTVEDKWIEDIEKIYPNIPSDLKYLFKKIGYGSVGDSSYMIHVPMEPDEVYDDATAKELEGILIVGDDFMGSCEAYNTKKGWAFGCIGSDGLFKEYGSEIESFVDFLINWVSNEGV